jgi:hypothetical protein
VQVPQLRAGTSNKPSFCTIRAVAVVETRMEEKKPRQDGRGLQWNRVERIKRSYRRVDLFRVPESPVLARSRRHRYRRHAVGRQLGFEIGLPPMSQPSTMTRLCWICSWAPRWALIADCEARLKARILC